jgi:3-carboxy-cis,cis-muconate cycloisomerase
MSDAMRDSSSDFGLLDPLSHDSRSRELTSDGAWLQAMVDVEVALIRSLVRARLVPDWMDDVAESISFASDLDAGAIAADGRGGGNPVIPLVKQLGAHADQRRAGASDSVHVAATSQDVLDSAAMLVSRHSITEISRQLDTLAGSLAQLANLHRASPLAGRTLGQHASPTSFGLVVAGWLDGVLGARRRLDEVNAALPLQFGGSVGTLGVLFDIARARRTDAAPDQVVSEVVVDLAGRLALHAPDSPWHTNRIPIVELGAALAGVVGAIGSMAIDISVLSRTEIAEVSERLGAGEGSSSAMPHKRNPVTAVLLVASARRAPALVATLFDSLVAEDQRPSGAWHAEWTALRELLRLAIDAATAAVSLAGRLEVDVERMRSNLEFTDGLIYSERVATILAETLGKSDAFELVAEASREAVRTNRPLRVVVSARLAGADHDDELRARVWGAFDPDASLGSASAIIDRVLARARGQL